MDMIPYLRSLPRPHKLVLLAGLFGIAAGAIGIKSSPDVLWVKFFDNLHWTAGTIAAALFVWLRLYSTAPVHVKTHTWFAIGLTGYAIGQLVWDVQVAVGYSGFTGPADIPYLMLGPCVAYGLLYELFRIAGPGHRLPALLDVSALTVATLAFVLALYLPEKGDAGLLPLIVLIAYPATFLSAGCIGLVMTLELRLRLSWQWLICLFSIITVGLFWMDWNLKSLGGSTPDGTWLNVLWSIDHILLGIGLGLWQAERSENEKYDRVCEGLLRLLPLLTVVMACLSIVLVTGLPNVSAIVERLTLIAAPVVILLAMIKQVLLLKERDQLIGAQAALTREQERFRTLTLATTQMVWTTNAQGEVVQDIPSWRVFTGQSMDEVRGWGWITALHPDDVERTGEVWKRSLESRSIYETEYRIRRHDGEYRLFSVRGVPVYDRDGSVREWVGTCTDITEIRQTEDMIWRQANFDTLTGLPNRDMFRDRLKLEVKKTIRAELPLALLLVDLDQFKEVNDTLGHAMGDMLLKDAAQRICACVRESDTVARLGGDEFTVVLPEVSDSANVDDVAKKIINKLAEPFHLGSEVIYVSASVGITLYPNDTVDIDALMKNADQAMYVAKSKGRNCFSYFTKDLQESAQTRMHLTSDLRGALSAGQFRVYLQPIVELSTGRISKAEALLRWQHPTQGMINPMEFIHLAETAGLINEIGDWVFKQSVDWVSRWNKRGAGEFQISVNMSPVQFNSRSSPTQAWGEYLDRAGLSGGGSIVVEITEGLLLNAEVNVMDQLLMFRDIGIEVAIDDFGTGYSALSYLKKFDIDYLKIDKSFTQHLETDADNRALCEAIIVMAHKLGLAVIAEGVETEGQRKLLLSMGCDYGQGYLFARPMPEDDFVKFLELNRSL